MVSISVIVNREWVFRFPRSERDVALPRQEMNARGNELLLARADELRSMLAMM